MSNPERRNERDRGNGSDPRLPPVPANTDRGRSGAAGMRTTSINPRHSTTVDMSPIDQLRDDLRVSRDLVSYTKTSNGPALRIYTGHTEYLTFEDLVSEIDSRPVTGKVLDTFKLCRKQGVVGLHYTKEGRLVVGLEATEQGTGLAKSPISLSQYLNESLFVRLKSVLSVDPKTVDILLFTDKELSTLDSLTQSPEARKKALHQIDPEASATKIFYSVLHHAIQERASDVHIEPYKDSYRIRFRIDGEMKTRFSIPFETGLPLVAIIMNRAKMKLDDKRVPQDGTIRFAENDIAVDRIFDGWSLRAAMTPTVSGIGAVLRLLKAAKEDDFDITKIGMLPKLLDRVEQVISAPQGLVLVTGPTGSGKTTTLYAILRRLNGDNVKILTAEDPVEVTLTGTTQVEVNKAQDLGFPEILRSFLRQDPDIILVGEIRDEETSKTAIQAALTGHLVFATVHTNDSFGVIPRLEALGIDPERVQSTLSAVITQRLVRKLCESCKETYDAKEHINDLFGEKIVDQPIDLCRAKDHSGQAVGCKDCSSTGYFGRKPVLEIWVPGPEERSLILKGSADAQVLAKAAERNGMESMLQSALELVKSKQTSLKEVLDRVTSLHDLRNQKELARRVFTPTS